VWNLALVLGLALLPIELGSSPGLIAVLHAYHIVCFVDLFPGLQKFYEVLQLPSTQVSQVNS